MIGKLQDNGNGTSIQEFAAPVNGGELKYSVSIAGSGDAFDWTAPEGIKTSGESGVKRAVSRERRQACDIAIREGQRYGNPVTFAYPTMLYDPNGNFSKVKYRYDIKSMTA